MTLATQIEWSDVSLGGAKSFGAVLRSDSFGAADQRRRSAEGEIRRGDEPEKSECKQTRREKKRIQGSKDGRVTVSTLPSA